jgi:hypothetical protein
VTQVDRIVPGHLPCIPTWSIDWHLASAGISLLFSRPWSTQPARLAIQPLSGKLCLDFGACISKEAAARQGQGCHDIWMQRPPPGSALLHSHERL